MTATPRTITAHVHPDILARVTRMYTADVADVLGELLQNARRAQATAVTIVVTPNDDPALPDHPFRITLSDNGRGIDDPALLLSFGENGWNDALVQREDAAGMGFASLSSFYSTVSSRHADAPPFQVALTPDHFLGKAAASVEPDPGAPSPHGTRIAFASRRPLNAIKNDIFKATRYYPLPVALHVRVPGHETHDTPPRRAYLDGSVFHADWEGIHVGIRPVRHPYQVTHNTNFQGHTLKLSLPETRTLDGMTWMPFLDVKTCARLQLVLPARKEAVETAFLDRLRAHLQVLIYRAIRESPAPYVPHAAWQHARSVGVDLPLPPPRLAPWVPALANEADDTPRPAARALPGGAFVVHGFDTPAQDHTLARALDLAGLADLAFAPDALQAAYPWHQALPQLTAMDVFVDGLPLADYDPAARQRQANAMPVPTDLSVRFTLTDPGGAETVRTQTVDCVLDGEPWDWQTDEAAWLITPGADMDVDRLVRLLEGAFFSYCADFDSDTYDTEHARFTRQATACARERLLADDERRSATLRDTLRRHPWLFEPGRRTVITICGDDLTLTCEPAQTAADPSPLP